MLAGIFTATSLIAMAPLGAKAYTAVFDFTGNNIGNGAVVNSLPFTSNGLTLTINGLNGGGFRVQAVNGLCAYWSKNSDNDSSNTCKNFADTSYNGLRFTLTSNQTLYNVRLTSLDIGLARYGSYTTGGATDTIISTFSGAPGSSGTYSQIPAVGSYNFSTPISADSNNSILLCSTPNITDSNGQSQTCTGNIVNGNNGITNTSFYTIKSMTFTYDTPGPLPLLGTGAAFAWSRRLRRRIASSRSGLGG